MKYKHSLRFRITLSFFLFGTLLAALIALAVRAAIEDIEQRLVIESLRLELDHFMLRYSADQDTRLPFSTSLTGGIVRPGDASNLPPLLQGLGPGVHEVVQGAKTFQIAIGDLGPERIYLIRDASFFERRERAMSYALLAVAIGASVIALWLGYMLSRRVIAPVVSLADLVAHLEADKPAPRLAAGYADDEVGELAKTFDRYLVRLHQFVEREQEFTANASHELRTPLTVIKSAVELLAADSQIPERCRRILKRVERAARGMSQVVESLLFLAREQSAGVHSGEGCRLSEVVQQALDDNRYLVADRPIALSAVITRDFSLPVPAASLTIVVGNLLRNAIAYTPRGKVVVRIDNGHLEVADTGIGIAADELPHVFERHYRGRDASDGGSGLGLSIVKRICDRHGWRTTVVSDPQMGTSVTIRFALPLGEQERGADVPGHSACPPVLTKF